MEKEGVEWKRVEEKTRISFGLDLKTIFWQGYQKCNKQPSKLWVAGSIPAGRTISYRPFTPREPQEPVAELIPPLLHPLA